MLQAAQDQAARYLHTVSDDGLVRISRVPLVSHGRRAARDRELYASSSSGTAGTSVDNGGVPLAIAFKRRFLSFVLELECPSDSYDVTLDPEKTDVLFRDEEAVKQLLQQCVQDYFEGRSMSPEVLDRRPGQLS